MKFEMYTEWNEMPEQGESLPAAEGMTQLEDGVFFERIGLEKQSVETPEALERVAGDPEKDMENWHLQSENNSCAIVCQEFVAEQLLGEDFSEQKMIDYAQKHGWYHPETGTPISEVGKLLEAMGLNVERGYEYTVKELAEELETNGKAICGVSHLILKNPEYANMPFVRADHAVQVIGIDASNPADVRVILNDSGVRDGKGRSVPLDTFSKAWATSGNYAVVARKGAIA